MKTAASTTVPVVVGLSLSIAASAAPKELPRAITKPLVAVSGSDSQVREPSCLRVTTEKDWRSVWARHLGTSTADSYRALFEVDFDCCLVIVIFRGERIQTRRLEIESVSEIPESIVVRFNEPGYGIALGTNESAPPPERPYAFIVLPKTDKEIVIEEKIWSKEDAARNRPPKWKVVARLKSMQELSTNPQRES